MIGRGADAGADASPPHDVAAGHPAWRRIALGGGGGMFVAMGLGRFSFTAMVPALVNAGHLGPVEAGRIGMVNLLGFLLGAGLSVQLAARLSRRHVLTGAVAVCLTGLALSAVPYGFLWLAVMRGLVGFTTGLIMVLSLSLIAETAPASRRPTAASFMFAGVGLGILMSAVIVPALVVRGLEVAWAGLAAAGAVAAAVAVWGWRGATDKPSAPRAMPGDTMSGRSSLRSGRMQALLLAHALFSMGIVPHTLYWVDFLARGLDLGLVVGGFYWSVVGVFAILGPILTAFLARWVGTARALFIGFFALALGIAAPALWPSSAVLLLSSMLFGAQPGLSSLMAARARDLAQPDEMPRVMRAAILSNSAGAVIGGACVPWLYGLGLLGSQAGVFLIGGVVMLAGAIAAVPLSARIEPAVR